MADRFSIKRFANPSGEVVHRVEGYKVDGTRVRINKKTFGEAIAEKQRLEQEALGIANSICLRPTRLTDQELAEAEAAYAKLKSTSHTLEFAVTWFLKHWRPPTNSLTVKAASEKFIAEKKGENLRHRTMQDYECRLTGLVELTGERLVSEVQKDDLAPLIHREGVSVDTKNGDRRVLFTFFNWCVLNEHCTDNPVRKIKRCKSERKTPGIHTVEEAERLLNAARAYKNGVTLPYVALSLFGGFRPNELAGLKTVKFCGGTIKVDSSMAKLRQVRVVEDLKTAYRWLKGFDGSEIVPTNFRRDFDAVKRLAGFQPSRPRKTDKGLKPWTPDVLRHTALSYHYALHRDENRTAQWAGNSPDTVHRFYKHPVSQRQARAFWKLTPAHAVSDVVELREAA